MAIVTFDVEPTHVHDDFFPQTTDYTANTAPSLTTVERWIQQEAALLAGKLALKSISAEGVFERGDEDTAFVWCAYTITLAVAVRVARVVTGLDPDIAKAWAADLKQRYADLDDSGELALGFDSSGSASEPEGPTDHISELDLDVGDTSEASSVAPALRRDDTL